MTINRLKNMLDEAARNYNNNSEVEFKYINCAEEKVITAKYTCGCYDEKTGKFYILLID